MWPLQSDSDRNGSLLSYILSSPDGGSLFTLQTIGDFVSDIPSRLGHNAALDESIACLCSIYVDVKSHGRRISNITIKRYAGALNSLQRCLDDVGMRYQSETVCASIILQLCEVCTQLSGIYVRIALKKNLLITRLLVVYQR